MITYQCYQMLKFKVMQIYQDVSDHCYQHIEEQSTGQADSKEYQFSHSLFLHDYDECYST
mgnify:CR=1 FL=1